MSCPDYKFAHLSDLHFSKVDFHPKQLLSKRWLGNANFLFRRKKEFDYAQLEQIIPILRKEQVSLVLISGDVSCTSSEAEFQKTLHFTKSLHHLGIEVLVLPGNHDQYTKESYRTKLFYRFFPSTLQTNKFLIKPLSGSWSLVALDTALPTPLFCSHGCFDEQLENKLEQALSELPKEVNIILANHFPIASKAMALKRERHLLSLIKKHPNIKLYLHGHLHRPAILDLRSKQLPVMIDSGSATHKAFGNWNLVACKAKECQVTPYRLSKDLWTPQPSFSLLGD